jgi:peptidoglycan biosynthesis protein MviN/MurJ (putative lipid II flippase)
MQIFYAYRDTKTPFWIGLVASAGQLLVSWFLGLVMGLGNVGIAFGFALAKTIKVGVMWWYLRPNLTGFRWPSLMAMLAKTGVACAVMMLVVGMARGAAFIIGLDLTSRSYAAAFVGAASGLGLIVYGAVSVLMGIDEVQPVLAKIMPKVRKLLRKLAG